METCFMGWELLAAKPNKTDRTYCRCNVTRARLTGSAFFQTSFTSSISFFFIFQPISPTNTYYCIERSDTCNLHGTKR
jgi:hypothetical protein